ncbi:MAG: phosphatidylglycerophosphatase A [Kiritimatiellae bacterium]|nr:phosphatidylglycerophosphatase A [Kiritimatiellia bacterium]
MRTTTFMQRVTIGVATGFGLGNAPIASGTFGALLGLPLALGFSALYDRVWWQAAIALLLTLLAVPVCDAAERYYGRKDDGRIVADEFLTLPIVVIGLPILRMIRQDGRVVEGFLLLGTAFVISRVCDICKPTPARQSQRIKGGWGIVLDDFFASLYALILPWGEKDLLERYVFPALA